MKVLLDTHVFLWAIAEPDRLSRRARQLLQKGIGPLLSTASLWEIALKTQSGKLVLPGNPGEFLLLQIAKLQALPLPIHPNHVWRTFELPPQHKDPFDRLLVAQALEEHAAIMTVDPRIAEYPVEIIW